MLERIAGFIEQYRMFEDGQRVGVAVSGGADSVFLLCALKELAPRWSLELSVIHVDHGIRGNASAMDAEFVKAFASKLDLPFHFRRATVTAVDDNLEQAARNARLTFFQELRAPGTVNRIATGHTRSDQAETVLYRLLRGSGLAGLAGILPVTESGLVRPLLQTDRPQIEAWLRERSITWRSDETNHDQSFARNRLRHDILPLLRDVFNPRLDEALSNLATLAQDEEAYWNGELDHLLVLSPGQTPVVNAVVLTQVPRAVARRLVRRAIQAVRGDLRQIDFQHVERVLEMAEASEGHDRVQLPGVDVLRSFEWIRIAKPGSLNELPRDFSLPVQVPASVELPDASARINLQVKDKGEFAQPYVTVVDELDWLRLTEGLARDTALELRNWRPGDQYRRAGESKEEKLKFLFQEARVPLWERRKWPIITYNGSIIWARRFGAAADFAAGPTTRIVLRVGETSYSESNPSDRE